VGVIGPEGAPGATEFAWLAPAMPNTSAASNKGIAIRDVVRRDVELVR
jgi:hypothetical protein